MALLGACCTLDFDQCEVYTIGTDERSLCESKALSENIACRAKWDRWLSLDFTDANHAAARCQAGVGTCQDPSGASSRP